MKIFLLATVFAGFAAAQCASGLYTSSAAGVYTCLRLGRGLILDGGTLAVNGAVLLQSVLPTAGQTIVWNPATGWTPATLPSSPGIVMPRLVTHVIELTIAPNALGVGGTASFIVDFDPSVYDLNVLMQVNTARGFVRAGTDYNFSAVSAFGQWTVTIDSNTNVNTLAGAVWPAGTVVEVRWTLLE